MKRIFTLLWMCILGSTLFGQDPLVDYLQLASKDDLVNRQILDDGDLQDSSVSSIWYTDDQIWLNDVKHNFSYDPYGNLIADSKYGWNGSEWQITRIETYEYDQNNHQTYELGKNWDGENFINDEQTFMTYDADGNRMHVLYQSWVDSLWEDVFVIDDVYGPDHQRLSSISQFVVNGVLTNFDRTVYTYVDGKLDSYLDQNWDDQDGWVNSRQYFFTYEGDLLKNYLVQAWNSDTWQDSYRNIYDYNAHDDYTKIVRQKALAGGAWENDYQNIFEYDGMNNLIYEAYQDFVSGILENSAQYFYTNDDRHNLLTEKSQYWTGSWENSDSIRYFYTLASGVKNINYPLEGIKIYPNPSTDVLSLETLPSVTGELKVSFFTNDGTRVLESTVSPLRNQVLDISKLTAGSYRILIQNGKSIAVKEFIKI